MIERNGVLGVEIAGRFIPAISGGGKGSPKPPAPAPLPPPPPPPPPAPDAPPTPPTIDEAATKKEGVKAKRTGTSSLRIDLNTGGASAGSGLNIPR